MSEGGLDHRFDRLETVDHQVGVLGRRCDILGEHWLDALLPLVSDRGLASPSLPHVPDDPPGKAGICSGRHKQRGREVGSHVLPEQRQPSLYDHAGPGTTRTVAGRRVWVWKSYEGRSTGTPRDSSSKCSDSKSRSSAPGSSKPSGTLVRRAGGRGWW